MEVGENDFATTSNNPVYAFIHTSLVEPTVRLSQVLHPPHLSLQLSPTKSNSLACGAPSLESSMAPYCPQANNSSPECIIRCV